MNGVVSTKSIKKLICCPGQIVEHHNISSIFWSEQSLFSLSSWLAVSRKQKLQQRWNVVQRSINHREQVISESHPCVHIHSRMHTHTNDVIQFILLLPVRGHASAGALVQSVSEMMCGMMGWLLYPLTKNKHMCLSQQTCGCNHRVRNRPNGQPDYPVATTESELSMNTNEHLIGQRGLSKDEKGEGEIHDRGSNSLTSEWLTIVNACKEAAHREIEVSGQVFSTSLVFSSSRITLSFVTPRSRGISLFFPLIRSCIGAASEENPRIK